jgi:poly(glycerol-phosphate) alpha-glucosyltransferase
MTNEPLRLAVAAHGISRLQGGMFYSVRELWKAVQRRGAAVSVHAIADQHSDEDAPTYSPLEWHLHPRVGPHRVGWSPALGRALMAEAPGLDMISLHGAWIPIAAGVVRAHRRHRLPYVIHPQGMLDPWALANAKAKKAVARVLWQNEAFGRAFCLRALCQSELRSFRAYGIRQPVAVIPNGVALDQVENLPPAGAFHARHPALDGRPFVLFIGRIHAKKGLAHFLEAWARVKPRDLALVIAGFDEVGHQRELEAIVAAHGLERDVHFVGELRGEAKREALAAASWYALPSFSEGFPMAILEAAACGIPVLMTPQCNFPELTAAGGALEMEPTADSAAALLGRLGGVADTERAAMGAAARTFVRANYNWDVIGAQMLRVCEWMTGRAGQPEFVENAR